MTVNPRCPHVLLPRLGPVPHTNGILGLAHCLSALSWARGLPESQWNLALDQALTRAGQVQAASAALGCPLTPRVSAAPCTSAA